jgi:hypothetical protein
MRDVRTQGPYADVVLASSPILIGGKALIEFGVKSETFQCLTERRLFSSIAQYYGLVQDGMQQTRHMFRGLKRPLAVAGNMNADQDVLIYSWKPRVDYEWVGTFFNGLPVERAPGNGMVFVVLVHIHGEFDEGSGVKGDIVKWNWIREDQQLAEAPVGWEHRYEKHLGSLK